MGIPENIVGFQHAHSDDGYAGIFCYVDYQVNGREYIQAQLTECLVGGIDYEVSFHASLADKFMYAISSLGAYLSDTAFISSESPWLEAVPQVVNPAEVILNDKEGWTRISGVYNSRDGGECFITIGNFNTDEESSLTFVDSGATPAYNKSYYYIDDVSVVALDSIPDNIAEQEQLSFNAWPNPATTELHIRSGQPLAQLRLLDISGRAVLSENMVTDRHTLQLSGIPPGLYLLEATDTEGLRAVKKVVVQ